MIEEDKDVENEVEGERDTSGKDWEGGTMPDNTDPETPALTKEELALYEMREKLAQDAASDVGFRDVEIRTHLLYGRLFHVYSVYGTEKDLNVRAFSFNVLLYRSYKEFLEVFSEARRTHYWSYSAPATVKGA